MVAFGAFLYCVHLKLVTVADGWYAGALLIFITCVVLAVVGALTATLKFFNAGHRLGSWFARRADAKALAKHIPFMEDRHKQIIGFLLERNQRTLRADSDGGHAAELISMRVIVPNLVHGQRYDMQNMPFAIPDHMWEVIVKHREHFPTGVGPTHPRRVHYLEKWQLRQRALPSACVWVHGRRLDRDERRDVRDGLACTTVPVGTRSGGMSLFALIRGPWPKGS